jgi:hypothetical protein
VAWVDLTYVRNLIGTSQATALGLSTAADVRLVQFEAAARSIVQSLMQSHSYSTLGTTLGTTATSTPFLRKLVGSLMVRDLYGFRVGIAFPPQVQDGLAILAAYERGEGKRFPIPGLTQDTATGVGGTDVTPTTYSDGSTRTLAFSLSKTRGL